MDEYTRIIDRLDGHSERLRALESDRKAERERHTSVLVAIGKVEDTIERTIKKMEKNYVTKEAFTSEGKFSRWFYGALGATMTFIFFAILGTIIAVGTGIQI